MSTVEPTVLEEAHQLVERWAHDLGHPWPEMDSSAIRLMRITMTKLVKERMAADIAALLNDVVHREKYTA